MSTQDTTTLSSPRFPRGVEVIEISDADYRGVSTPCGPLEDVSPVASQGGARRKTAGSPRDRKQQA